RPPAHRRRHRRRCAAETAHRSNPAPRAGHRPEREGDQPAGLPLTPDTWGGVGARTRPASRGKRRQMAENTQLDNALKDVRDARSQDALLLAAQRAAILKALSR